MDNLGFDVQDVAGAHRVWPAQLIDAETDCAFRKVQRLNKKTHGDRRRMPAARNQSLEDRSLSGFGVEMKFLRIKFLGELDDGFACNFKRFGLKPVARVRSEERRVGIE